MLHAQDVFHQVVSLADELHVAILYPVVHHLHKVSCSLVSHLAVREADDTPEKPVSNSLAQVPPHTENNKCKANTVV